MLRTLTVSYSDDTIYALAVTLSFLHLAFHDYSYANTTASGHFQVSSWPTHQGNGCDVRTGFSAWNCAFAGDGFMLWWCGGPPLSNSTPGTTDALRFATLLLSYCCTACKRSVS